MPLFWFKDGYAVLAEENFFLNYSIIADRFSNIWGNFELGGKSTMAFLTFPNFIFFRLLADLGIPAHLQQQIYFLLIWLFSSVFLFCIVKRHTSSLVQRFIIFLAAASIYFLNFDTLYNRPFYSFKSLPLVLVPLFYILATKYKETKKSGYLVICAVLILVFQSLIIDPASYFITVFAVFVPFIEELQLPSKKVVLNLVVFILTPLFFSILAMYISIYHFDRAYASEVLSAGLARGFTNSLFSNFPDVINTASSWWRYKENNAEYYFGSYKFYEIGFINLISYIPFVSLIFLYVMLYYSRPVEFVKERKSITVLFLLLLVFIFMAKGLSHPLEYITKLAFSISKYMYIFRDTRKFYLISTFIEALLALKLLTSAFNRKPKLAKYIAMFIFIGGLVYTLPVFTGGMFQPRNSKLTGKHTDIKIPNYWHSAAEYINPRDDCRIMVFPQASTDVYEYSWYKTSIGNGRINLPYYIFNKPLITGKSYYSYSNDRDKLYDFFYNHPSEAIFNGNICHILVQKDVITQSEGDAEIIIPKGYVSKKDFGQLELYEYASNNGNLYITDNFFTSNDPLESLNRLENAGYSGLDILDSSKKDEFSKTILIPSINVGYERLLNSNWNNGWEWEFQIGPEPNSNRYLLARKKEAYIFSTIKEREFKLNFLLRLAARRLSEARYYPDYKEELVRKAYESLLRATDLLFEKDSVNKDKLGYATRISTYAKRAHWETKHGQFFDLYSTIPQRLNKANNALNCADCAVVETHIAGMYDMYFDLRPYEDMPKEEIKFTITKVVSSVSFDIRNPEILQNGDYRWAVTKNVPLDGKSTYLITTNLGKKSLNVGPAWYSTLNPPRQNVEELSFYSELPSNNNTFYALLSDNFERGQNYVVEVSYVTVNDDFKIGIMEKYNSGTAGSKFRQKSIIDHDEFHCSSVQAGNEVCNATRVGEYTFSDDAQEAFLYVKFPNEGNESIEFSFESINILLDREPESFLVSSASFTNNKMHRTSIPSQKLTSYKYTFKLDANSFSPQINLIFKEAFDRGWLLYKKTDVNNRFGEILKEFNLGLKRNTDGVLRDHRVTNGYANSWIIENSDDLSGEYVLLYFPGLVFEIFKYATYALIGLLLLTLVVLTIKRKQ